jgi:ABC-2 type transport system ATP-binding protein
VQSVIAISELTRSFAEKRALDSVSLSIDRGGVYGLVGANGAGKTTLIRHILGLLRAQAGSVRVFDRDPVAEPVAVLSRIGYLSEENDLPGWMRVEELVRYSRAFYPNWDDAYSDELQRAFSLDPHAKIKTMSKGQKARTGLVAALSHRPELLVLDEPSSGLDPIVRRDILGAVMRTIADEGRTVLFSSHLLEEVEQVADHVTMIDQGRIALSAPLQAMKESHRSITIRLTGSQPRPPALPGVLRWEGGTSGEWSGVFQGSAQAFREAVERLHRDVTIVGERIPSLDEIFVAHVGRHASQEGE